MDSAALVVLFQTESKCLFVLSEAENTLLPILDKLIGRIRWKKFILFLAGDREKLIKFQLILNFL
jgi:hypothetical protein